MYKTLPTQKFQCPVYGGRRNATARGQDALVSADLREFAEAQGRMARAGFNTSLRHPVVDTLWMVWPTGDEVAERMSRLWTHEVARFSSYEKVSYSWVASQLPEFRPRLTDAIYIYSPEQRCAAEGGGGGNASHGGKGAGSRRGSGKKRLRGARSRRLTVRRARGADYAPRAGPTS